MTKRYSKLFNFIFICSLFVTACASPDAAESQNTHNAEPTQIETIETDEKVEETQVENNKVIVVVARDRYQSLEFNPVVDALKKENYQVVIASDEIGTATGTTENTEVEITFSDIDASNYIGIFIIGGSNSLWYNAELHKVLKDFDSEDSLIAAICYGSVALATSGIIGEDDIACWYNSPESDPIMEEYKVVDSEEDVTVEGNIITGDGPNAAEEFAQEIVNHLNS